MVDGRYVLFYDYVELLDVVDKDVAIFLREWTTRQSCTGPTVFKAYGHMATCRHGPLPGTCSALEALNLSTSRILIWKSYAVDGNRAWVKPTRQEAAFPTELSSFAPRQSIPLCSLRPSSGVCACPYWLALRSWGAEHSTQHIPTSTYFRAPSSEQRPERAAAAGLTQNRWRNTSFGILINTRVHILRTTIDVEWRMYVFRLMLGT